MFMVVQSLKAIKPLSLTRNLIFFHPPPARRRSNPLTEPLFLSSTFLLQNSQMGLRSKLSSLSSFSSLPLRLLIKPSHSLHTSSFDAQKLHTFLHDHCKSGNVTLPQALAFFNYMVLTKPTPPVSDFNILLASLVKKRHYAHVVAMFAKMGSADLLRNFCTWNILLNCLCSARMVSYGFVVVGCIYRSGHKPDVVTFTTMIRCLCQMDKIHEAVRLFENMGLVGCPPDVVTCSTLMKGLCEIGNIDITLRLHEEMVKVKSKFGINCKPNRVTYNTIIDGFCKNGLVENAKQIFIEMKENTYSALLYGLCFEGEWEQAKNLKW